MGWQVGYDPNWNRWVGYGIPAVCDQPDCGAEIDRGLGRVCGSDIYGGEDGCGLFFCENHRAMVDVPSEAITAGTRCAGLCERCVAAHEAGDDFASFDPFDPTPDTAEWVDFLLTDESWAEWRADNPDEVQAMQRQRATVSEGDQR